MNFLNRLMTKINAQFDIIGAQEAIDEMIEDARQRRQAAEDRLRAYLEPEYSKYKDLALYDNTKPNDGEQSR